MFGFLNEDDVKRDILDYINECIKSYEDTRDKEYLYRLLEFCNWLLEISDSIVRILKSYGIPITTKTEEEIPKIGKPIFSAEITAEPIVIRIPKIELKLPKEVETKPELELKKETSLEEEEVY